VKTDKRRGPVARSTQTLLQSACHCTPGAVSNRTVAIAAWCHASRSGRIARFTISYFPA
jgi:hypothetical protein